MARKIQFKRGPKSRLAKLSLAELAFTDDEKKLYVGDGAENIRLLDQKDKTEITAALVEKAKQTDLNSTIANLTNKVDKNGSNQISHEMLQQSVKEAITGGALPVVGIGGVNLYNLTTDVIKTFSKETTMPFNNKKTGKFINFSNGTETVFVGYSYQEVTGLIEGELLRWVGGMQGTGVYAVIFMNANNEVIDKQVRGGDTTTSYDSTFRVPLGTVKTYFNFKNGVTTNVYRHILIDNVPNNIENLNQRIESVDSRLDAVGAIKNNQWMNKKVVWIGTSVSFGANATKSYAAEASDKLGFNLINASVPGLAIHTNSDGTKKTYGSSALSKAEYLAQGTTIPATPITPYVPGGSYNDYYRTWENVFTPENADTDLWVFDVVPNNTDFSTTDWDLFTKSQWVYSDGSTFEDHRKTFLGALLFLMDKMYQLNPKARMALILSSSFQYSNGKTALEKLKSQWNIPVIDLWGKANTTPKALLQLYSKDGTDPHPSTYAHELLGNILTNELLIIS